MATITFDTVVESDMRDSHGSTMKIVTMTGISGNYTKGGVVVTPEQFDLGDISFIGVNNFFAFPVTNNEFDLDGDWEKAVDIFPTQVSDGNGGFDWKLVIFLYAIDGAELPEIPMGFIEDIPINMIIVGTKKTRRRAL